MSQHSAVHQLCTSTIRAQCRKSVQCDCCWYKWSSKAFTVIAELDELITKSASLISISCRGCDVLSRIAMSLLCVLLLITTLKPSSEQLRTEPAFLVSFLSLSLILWCCVYGRLQQRSSTFCYPFLNNVPALAFLSILLLNMTFRHL